MDTRRRIVVLVLGLLGLLAAGMPVALPRPDACCVEERCCCASVLPSCCGDEHAPARRPDGPRVSAGCGCGHGLAFVQGPRVELALPRCARDFARAPASAAPAPARASPSPESRVGEPEPPVPRPA